MSLDKTEIIHATCISIAGVGVLLRAPSGGGKSDLALRLIDQPGRGIGKDVMAAVLIADDRVALWQDQNRLMASCPNTLSGLLEVRGLGIVQLAHEPAVQLELIVDLVAKADIERMPDLSQNRHSLCGVVLPAIAIAPFEASAPAKLRAAVCALAQGCVGEGVPAQYNL